MSEIEAQDNQAKKPFEEDQNSQVQREKRSKNLLLLGCISIVMMFAGLTSAYLVIRMDNFWVQMSMPFWFVISTVIILLSSLTYFLAVKSAKNNNHSMIKVFMVLSLLGGVGFTISQVKGWKELMGNGYYFISKIIADNRYGERVNILKDGVPFEYVDGVFYRNKEALDKEETEEVLEYAKLLAGIDELDVNAIQAYSSNYSVTVFTDSSELYDELVFKNGEFLNVRDSLGIKVYEPLLAAQRIEIKRCAQNLVDGIGTFQIKGEYGKDFRIMYNGDPLQYENGVFYFNDKRLKQEDIAKLESTKNTASSFVYILSFMHLLHLIGGWIYMSVTVVGAFREKYDQDNYLKIKMGSIYWHFLGGLWIFLYGFLTFIH